MNINLVYFSATYTTKKIVTIIAEQFSHSNVDILTDVICPQKARSFGGLLYKITGKKIVKTNSARKELEVFIPSGY